MAAPDGAQAATMEPRWRLGFWGLIVTQFQGAFSDNALKALVTFIGLSLAATQRERENLIPLTTLLFSLPFILFSMGGGYLADRFSKRSVTILIKLFEICVMLCALAGFAGGHVWIGLFAIFLMGTHSAVFSPSKYGLLPELLPEKRLSWGNGILELGTFLAIILGTAGGAWLYDAFKGRHALAGLVLIGLAVFGLFTSLVITRVPAADPRKVFRANPLADLIHQVKLIRIDRVLWLAVLGNIYFWFLGSLVQQNVFIFGTDTLHLSEIQTSYLLAALAIGIGVGSFAAGYLSGQKIEYGLVPLGSIGLTVCGLALWRTDLLFWSVLFKLALLGFFGGFFIVPISAIMQHRPEKAQKGAVLAAGSLLSFVGIALAAGMYWALTAHAGVGPRGMFFITALLGLAGTAYIAWLLPDALLRLLLWLGTHSIYRIRVEGRDNIPERGGALFVSNHVSLADALLLLSSTDRALRPLIFKDIYDHPVVKPFARIMRAIPISSALRPREMIRALREAGDEIRAGGVVCIFAEGQITRIGQMLPFRRGFERIMKDVDAPIIPVCLDGVWGSIFSFEKGRFLWKVPHYFPYPVTVSFGKPMPATSTAHEVREAVQALNTDAWRHRRSRMRPLHRAFVNTARRHPLRFAMADALVPRLSFGGALVRTVFLARRLKPLWEGQESVGIFLPPSVGGALVNYAALLTGRVPVNLNYTASDEIIASCARQCGIRTVVTSRAFLERVKLTVPGTPIFIEDLVASPGPAERAAALFMAFGLPRRILERALGNAQRVGLDDLATVIFSSGSTGDPKGVMLTHYNILSNVEQFGQTFAFRGSDRLLGILPFFHSFGFTGTLMVPAAQGIGVVYHPTPLDPRAIAELIVRYRVTFMLATPTFLQIYTRRCPPEAFGSLQYVVTGAEKLPERLAQAFQDRFGLRPLEGYGCTECSPVVAVNTRDFRAAGFRQVGAKRGKIGHPLPGVSVRIVDPDTGELQPLGRAGLLEVRGPNVMKGYLGLPGKTAEVLRDGWYVTGDVAALDEDGFLEITDRLSRFSKIGGEMVPHIKVEETLQDLAGVADRCFAVAGVPDEKKGERLVVLHTLSENELAVCLGKLASATIPNLWKPRADQFFHIQALPQLGSGKLDLRGIRERALALSAGAKSPDETS